MKKLAAPGVVAVVLMVLGVLIVIRFAQSVYGGLLPLSIIVASAGITWRRRMMAGRT